MEKIEWITPVRGTKTNSPNQVRVKKTTVSWSPKKIAEYTEVIFCGTSSLMITKGDYIKAGVGAKRIYFDVGDRTSGYKLTRGYKEQRYVRLRGWRERFLGVHDLKFDEEQCLWYIEA